MTKLLIVEQLKEGTKVKPTVLAIQAGVLRYEHRGVITKVTPTRYFVRRNDHPMAMHGSQYAKVFWERAR